MKPWIPLLFGVCLCGTMHRASAEKILWFSDPGLPHLDSAGLPMDSSFQFELGVFASGFAPSPGNTDDWDDFWVAADSSSYQSTNQRFAGLFEVVENTAPFAVGAAGWIMGRRDSAGGSERILFRSSGWLWPSPDPMNPLSLEWNVKDATLIVLGEIRPSSIPFLMQSAAMESSPLSVTWEEWRITNLAGEPLDGPNDDPDSDGVPNLLEFAFGSLPKQAGPPPVTPVELVEVDDQTFLQITVPRQAGHEVDLTVEVSSDLIVWNSGSTHTEVISDTTESLVVRDKTAHPPTGGRRFMRVAAALPGE